ncbi:hypothetical protein CK203_103843 [Vitis vinifera]|uniref:Uncharacterized protein n=1 Tax=Vitis vinifera TaxID=29760 RepID=A0A438CHM2_VITVI|nr:hypothetical protein CK203_103843 [Vitis vinifera]
MEKKRRKKEETTPPCLLVNVQLYKWKETRSTIFPEKKWRESGGKWRNRGKSSASSQTSDTKKREDQSSGGRSSPLSSRQRSDRNLQIQLGWLGPRSVGGWRHSHGFKSVYAFI